MGSALKNRGKITLLFHFKLKLEANMMFTTSFLLLFSSCQSVSNSDDHFWCAKQIGLRSQVVLQGKGESPQTLPGYQQGELANKMVEKMGNQQCLDRFYSTICWGNHFMTLWEFKQHGVITKHVNNTRWQCKDRWDGMGWDGMGWDGMGWDGMGLDRRRYSMIGHDTIREDKIDKKDRERQI